MSKITDWQDQDAIAAITGWAMCGLTNPEIAKNMGIEQTTLWRWASKNADICNALKKGKDFADSVVVNSLYKRAVSGDVTACIFWLKNRRSREWRDKVSDDDISFSDGLKTLNEAIRGVKNE